jgi:hypothetical protein
MYADENILLVRDVQKTRMGLVKQVAGLNLHDSGINL